jgi:hypothetical protein
MPTTVRFPFDTTSLNVALSEAVEVEEQRSDDLSIDFATAFCDEDSFSGFYLMSVSNSAMGGGYSFAATCSILLPPFTVMKESNLLLSLGISH